MNPVVWLSMQVVCLLGTVGAGLLYRRFTHVLVREGAHASAWVCGFGAAVVLLKELFREHQLVSDSWIAIMLGVAAVTLVALRVMRLYAPEMGMAYERTFWVLAGSMLATMGNLL